MCPFRGLSTCKQCFCTHKALHLSIQSPLALQELVGQHPKPFNRAAPAGRSTSAVTILLTSTKCFPAAYIFVTPRKHTILPSSAKWLNLHRQLKAPRPRQRAPEGFCLCLWVVFLAVGSISALTAPAGGSCMMQKQKAAAFLQRPSVTGRDDTSRISKQRVTAVCSVLRLFKYLIHREHSTTLSNSQESPSAMVQPPGIYGTASPFPGYS